MKNYLAYFFLFIVVVIWAWCIYAIIKWNLIGSPNKKVKQTDIQTIVLNYDPLKHAETVIEEIYANMENRYELKKRKKYRLF